MMVRGVLVGFALLVLLGCGRAAPVSKKPVAGPEPGKPAPILAEQRAEEARPELPPRDALAKALTLYQQGQEYEARRILASSMKHNPHSPWNGRIFLVMGYWHLGAGERQAAVGFLQQAVREHPLVMDYALVWLAESALDAGAFEEARTLYQQALACVPDSVLAPEAGFGGAQALALLNRPEEAAHAYEHYLKTFPRHPLVPMAFLGLGEAWRAAGRPEEAQGAWKRVLVDHPAHTAARQAVDLLKQHVGYREIPKLLDREARMSRASALARSGALSRAAAEWLALVRDFPGDGGTAWEAAKAQFYLGRYEDAIRLMRRSLKLLPRREAEIRYWLARAYYRQGLNARVRRIARRLDKRHPGSIWTARSLDLEARTWAEAGHLQRATRHFLDLARRFPQETIAVRSLWEAGWLQYRRGAAAQAAGTFRTLASKHPRPPLGRRALYWYARASEASGTWTQARETYQRLVRERRHDYYAYLAQDRLKHHGESVPSIRRRGRRSAVAELRTGFNSPDPAAPGPVSLEPPNGLHYRKGLELLSLGLVEQGSREMRRSQAECRKDLPCLLGVNAHLLEADQVRAVIQSLGRRHAGRLLGLGSEPPQAFWRQAYPFGFWPAVEAAARRFGVDPLLVAAVIREESRFDPQAVSRAGAVGLMQLMPATARRVSLELRGSGLRAGSLFQVEDNVTLGTRYLTQLLMQWRGGVARALASYNAGPGAVERWVAQGPTPAPDAWVEGIPYPETRRYVKRVLKSYREYRRVYGGDAADGEVFVILVPKPGG